MSRHAIRLWLTVRDMMRAIGVKQCRPFHRDRLFVAAILAGCGFWVLLWWSLPLQPVTLRQAGSWQFMSLVAMQPCFEEAVFRGWLQGQLLRWGRGQHAWKGFTTANGVAAVLFAAAHLINHPTFWAAAVLLPALTFGFFRDRYDSIWPAVVLHIFYNTGYFILTGLPRTPSITTAD